MTTFEPGRIYSGDIHGKRAYLICAVSKIVPTADTTGFVYASSDNSEWRWAAPEAFTDVRGPLVVLDVPQMYATSWKMVADKIREGADPKSRSEIIAAQIEEQTRPSLQVGWHEVEEFPHPMYFGGGDWRYAPSRYRSRNQSLTSTYYIGPASGDES